MCNVKNTFCLADHSLNCPEIWTNLVSGVPSYKQKCACKSDKTKFFFGFLKILGSWFGDLALKAAKNAVLNSIYPKIGMRQDTTITTICGDILQIVNLHPSAATLRVSREFHPTTSNDLGQRRQLRWRRDARTHAVEFCKVLVNYAPECQFGKQLGSCPKRLDL